MSSSRPALSVRDLAKSYRILHNDDDHVTVAELALSRLRHPFRRARRDEVWALDDVSFDVHQGEVVGIIGRNGAGKSTLLRLLTRISEPTRGEIDLWGRVGSLLEVGTGFHPELTGRENIHLNGSILGMTRREIVSQFDEIVEFAGVERFLDTPVKRYSSGMYVRLAFAVAAHLRSEILLLDEVLAVGDADFQAKCLGKLSELARGGRTVLLVSHSPAVIEAVAPRSILLQAGRVEADGSSSDVLAHYAAAGAEINSFRDLTATPRARGLGLQARFGAIEMTKPEAWFAPEEPIEYRLHIDAHEPLPAVALSQSLHTADGAKLGSSFCSKTLPLTPGVPNVVEVSLPPVGLAPGKYFLSIGLGLGDQAGNATFLDIVEDAIDFEVRASVGEDGRAERWDPTWGPIRLPMTKAHLVAPAYPRLGTPTPDVRPTS